MVEVNKIRFEKTGFESFLSPLEADILRVLWTRRNSRVRDIHKIINKRRKVALTSVAVILDRLHKKKIVSRVAKKGKGGYHYIYSTKVSREHLEHSIIDKTVNKLVDMFGANAVTYFNERFKKGKKR